MTLVPSLSVILAAALTVLSVTGGQALSMAWLTPDQRGAVRDWDRDRGSLPGASPSIELETFRLNAELTNASWENFRQSLEKQRQSGHLTQGSYEALIASYHDGIKLYRATIGNYKDASTQRLSGVANSVDAPMLYRSRAAVAASRLHLCRLIEQDIAAYSRASRAAMIESYAGAGFEPLRSYIQDTFPVAGDLTLDAYAQQVQGYATQVMENAANPFADLLVTSIPAGAMVVIRPKYGVDSRSESTEAPFPNLAIGRYRISVELPGYSAYVNENFDWLNNTQPKLACTLAPSGGTSSCHRGR